MSFGILYDATMCIGCKQCEQACATENGLRYDNTVADQKAIPGVRKCIMCAPRVAAGKPTACAEICPTGATKFGDREELLQEARKRVQDNPGTYLHHIYGETEVGGTSVLLLSSVDFQQFGYREDLTQRALPMYTYQVLSRIPDFVPIFGVLLGGVYWITHRREEVAEAEVQEEHANEKGGVQ